MLVSEALKYCWNALNNVSRSFALTVPMVEKKISIPIMIGYLEARIIDNFEDEGKFVSPKERLENIDKAVNIIFRSGDKNLNIQIKELYEIAKRTISNQYYFDLVSNIDKIIAVHNSMEDNIKKILERWLSEMAYGMKKFINKEIIDFSDLEEYCYYVAGTIGCFLTELVVYSAKEITETQIEVLNRTKKDFGAFLQKVNIIRDIREDIKRNEKIFWPKKLLEEYQLSLEKLIDEKYRAEAISVLSKMINNTKTHIQPTIEYIYAVPYEFKGYQKAATINFLMGFETLNKLKNNYEVFSSDIPVKIDTKIKEKIIIAPIEYLSSIQTDLLVAKR